MHPNDRALIDQLRRDVLKRYDQLTADTLDTRTRRLSLLLLIGLLLEIQRRYNSYRNSGI